MFIVYFQDVAVLKALFDLINFLQKMKNNDGYVFNSTPSRIIFQFLQNVYERTNRNEISWIFTKEQE